jgi:hypothetical protein
MMGAIS